MNKEREMINELLLIAKIEKELKELSKDDIEKVKEYVSFLKSQCIL